MMLGIAVVTGTLAIIEFLREEHGTAIVWYTAALFFALGWYVRR